MGTWGTGLYANDCSGDVRDTYMKFLQEQLSNKEAYQKTLEKFHEYIGDQDEPFLWYALADTQWKVGRLISEVKEKALKWIEKGGGLENWEESANRGAGWKKTLEKLKEKLESPMPPEKIIKKPVEFTRNPWNVGDVYAYQFHTEVTKERGLFGKYILIQKIGDIKWCDGWILSRIHVFDSVFNEIPTLDGLSDLRLLPLIDPIHYKDEYKHMWDPMRDMNANMVYYKKSDYKQKMFTFIGNRVCPANNKCSDQYPFWSEMDSWLSECYISWQNVEYETIGEGLYRYNPVTVQKK